MIKANIIGGAGFTAGELLRILVNHPDVQIQEVTSNSQAGKYISQVHEDLLGDCDLKFVESTTKTADVVFICSGHGKTLDYFKNNSYQGEKIIDLSNDFRLKPNNQYQDIRFIYGLPEMHREQIKTAQAIANPGCFATAMQLAILPLAANKLIAGDIHISGVTGSTGAGQKLQATTHFSWRNNNVSTYKTFTHQHLGEVAQTLEHFELENKPVHFIPYRGAFSRGIMINMYTDCELTEAAARELFNNHYKDHPFTHVAPSEIHLKQVTNTNKAIISLKKHADKILVSCAIDNLLKGASGQAVQNMNLMFGLAEHTGIKLKGNYF